MSEEQNNDRFLVGFIIGSSITTIASLIFHPKSGAKTRQILAKTSEAIPDLVKDFSTTLKIHGQDLSVFSRQKWQNTIRRVQVAIDAGIQASKMEAQAQQDRENTVTVEEENIQGNTGTDK